jgi:UDP-N-acetylmuramoylalanine--D-glutamate ligase
LKTAGIPTEMGGNIGLPILAQDPLPEGGVYVLELSSYQIDLTFSLDCDVAVLLNVTPDHLDRYDGGIEHYAAAKARLFRLQSRGHVRVIATNDRHTLRIADWLEGEAKLFDNLSASRQFGHASEQWDAAAVEIRGSVVRVSKNRVPGQENWPSLQGPHNAQNVAAARAVAQALGIGEAVVEEGLRTYPGLPHRMERVAEKSGILFVNDSKATNPDSTAPALAAYPHIHWIVGGLAKTKDLGPCAAQLGHVRAAYTIGDSGPMFAQLLAGTVPVTQCSVLVTAVTEAAEAAKAGEVVLLSPACASFDQFRDYEARGQAFRDAVGALS